MKPTLISAPQSARLPTAREAIKIRALFSKIRNSGAKITSEEINDLKIEKERLEQEIFATKQKLLKYKTIEEKYAQNYEGSDIYYHGVITEQMEKTRNNINTIINSDVAAQILELQEESKILFLEINRLRNSEASIRTELYSAKFKHERFKKKHSEVSLAKLRKKVEILEEKVIEQGLKNSQLGEVVEKLEESFEKMKDTPIYQKMSNEKNKISENIRQKNKKIRDTIKMIQELKK